ncbi:hypothetical protein [Limosilactobacillus panis]|uniref:Uncharacterized protein n=1 Tax=Limosilactobacillus panis TaxID=47493 RepID=A0ABT7VLW1_9LACO|nr:hypothetical protein [Limosilactobacillus panis]MDM8333727.1 hypothetical protein [Limosilactobacillus panis]
MIGFIGRQIGCMPTVDNQLVTIYRNAVKMSPVTTVNGYWGEPVVIAIAITIRSIGIPTD